jgi:hypothetical protein
MATLPTLDHFQDAPEVRPLPSTGITRLPRYYEPVRRPRRPGLSLAGVRLGSASPPSRVSRVASDLPVQACRRHYPGGTMDPDVARARAWSMTAAFPATMPGRLPQQDTFEACSAFTHVTACLFAEPLERPFSSRAPTGWLPPRSSRLLPAGATVAGWELHPLKIAAFARRTLSGVTTLRTPHNGMASGHQLRLGSPRTL